MKAIVWIVLISFLSGSLRSEIIYLKSGRMMKGKIVEETREKITLKNEQGSFEIEKREISRILESVKVRLRSGEVMTGKIKKEEPDYIVLETNGGSFKIERKAILGIVDVENIAENISSLSSHSVPIVTNNNEIRRYSVGGHVGIPLAFDAEGETDLALGLDPISFEFISANGWGIQFSPAAFYLYVSSKEETREYSSEYWYYTTYDTAETGSTYYVPILIKYSFQNEDPMPYLGFALAYHQYWYSYSYKIDEEESGLVPVFNLGVRFFPRKRFNFIIDGKFFPGTGAHEPNLFSINIGFNFSS